MKLTDISVQYIAGDSIYIIGTRNSICDFVEILQKGLVENVNLDPPKDTYPGAIEIVQIQIRSSGDKVLFTIEGNSLIIQGSLEMRNLASLSIKYLCEPPVSGKLNSDHSHLDAFDDHPFLDSASWPVVVSLADR